VRAGSGAATLGVPDSAGIARNTAASTLIARYNDAASVERAFHEHPGEIAAILVEPIAGNMGLVAPKAGFLKALRELASRHGALLVFDEVMTGFRVAHGGAIERTGVIPDLATLGKIIGGGLPVGAVAGPRALLRLLAPEGPVYQAGTFSGNPIVMAAGCATLDLLDEAAYETLERVGARLEAGLRDTLASTGTTAAVQRVGSMLTLFFGTDGVSDMDDARRADAAAFAAFFHSMLAAGVHLPPSAFESWFLSLAHDEASVDLVVAAAHAALASIAPGKEQASCVPC
jgi:glutamate-1-semialdehyde 2,1-aminomutase